MTGPDERAGARRHICGCTIGNFGGVGNKQAQRGGRPVRQALIGNFGLFDRIAIRDELRHLHGALFEQMEKRLDVPLLGPSDIPERIIASLLFIRTVVSARSVGHRQAELQLFLVIGFARQRHTDRTDDHDPPLLSSDLTGRLHRFVRLGTGGNDDTVDALSLAEGLGCFDQLCRIRHNIRAQFCGKFTSGAVEVGTQHPASGGLEQLHRQLSEQSQPDHSDPVA